MWSSLSYPWQFNLSQAWEAYCAGTIPIGAVIVDGGGRVIAAGRNRINQPREASAHHISGGRLAHAEINALFDLVPVGSPRDYTLYTTTEPCPMCAGAILMFGLRRVAFASRDPWAGSTNMYEATPYMRSKHMHVEGPVPGLESVLFVLQTEYFLQEIVRRGGVADPRTGPSALIEAVRAVDTGSVALGEHLYKTGELARLAASRARVEEVIDRIEALLFPARPLGSIDRAEAYPQNTDKNFLAPGA